jgi:NitT/TauT family transport system permease protein
MTKASVIAGRAAVAVLFVGLWQAGATLGWLDPFFFSKPSAIAARVLDMAASGKVWPHLAVTLTESVLSFLLGGLAGAAMGFALARSDWWAAVLGPYIQVANALPRVVLAPIFLLWFGLGIASKVALGVTVVFFIVFFGVDPERPHAGRERAPTRSPRPAAKRAHVDFLESRNFGRHGDHCRRRR